MKKTLADFEDIDKNKISGGDLGKGAYGNVRLVKDKSNGKLFALKVVSFKIFEILKILTIF